MHMLTLQTIALFSFVLLLLTLKFESVVPVFFSGKTVPVRNSCNTICCTWPLGNGTACNTYAARVAYSNKMLINNFNFILFSQTTQAFLQMWMWVLFLYIRPCLSVAFSLMCSDPKLFNTKILKDSGHGDKIFSVLDNFMWMIESATEILPAVLLAILFWLFSAVNVYRLFTISWHEALKFSDFSVNNSMEPELNLTNSEIYHVSTADPIKLVQLVSISIPHWFKRYRRLHPESKSWFSIEVLSDESNSRSLSLSRYEIAALVCLTLIIHFLRSYITKATELWVARNHIFPRYSAKFPESIFKLSYYGLSWIFSLCIHTCVTNINSFNDPLSMWNDWSQGRSPPIHPTILVIYATQTSFYIHSVYATLYLDPWRKDSWLMFIHHFIALPMLWLSYVENYTLCGALLLFLQDSSDALLEMAKIGIYLRRRRNGAYYKLIDYAGSTIFVLFAANWVLCRLYWYPCKLLYGTLYGAVYLGPQMGPYFPVLGTMLVLIYMMNIYWFNFIARMLWRVATTGEEPEDNREWDTSAVTGLSKDTLDAMAEKKAQ